MNNTQELHDGAKIGDGPATSAPRRKPSNPRQRHGLTRLIYGRSTALTPQLDARCKQMQAMNQYRRDLVASLGGESNLSQQELTLVSICARDWMILECIDSFLLSAGLFHKKKRTAYPLTVQRMQIADGLTKRLLALRLEKRSRPVGNASRVAQSQV